MGNIIPTSTSFRLPDGKEVVIETGKLATQAHGSVVVKVENTMLLATVVASPDAKPDQSFFPLSVDYQERFAAAGKIPGNFFRRETRLSDYEILISRLVDRAVRPLFPDTFLNETQIIINLISGDQKNMPDAYAALAASAALAVSDIPFDGPISEVRVAKINGKYIVNPERDQLATADLDLIIAATLKDVMMVEGEANECQESDIIEAIKIGHEAIKVQCEAQLALAKLVGDKALVKREVIAPEVDTELKDLIKSLANARLLEISASALDKNSRKNGYKEVGKAVKAAILEQKGEEYAAENDAKISEYFDKLKKNVIRQMVLDTGIRLDGRKCDEIRPIWCEVAYLPAAHGSAIFNRGETQSLTSLTLGTKLDQMMIDNALDNYYEKFILHYNFPGLSVGEVKPNRGPGRREVGHANLAGRSLKKVMPEGLPYTVRIVSDILESNGSSSMATVCAGSLALMDAGVKIKSAVSGIAMGMIAEGGRSAILSDILGDEDAIGDMDFKVTGTSKGITGCQMDIKVDGLPYETLEKALMQAKEGRLHILGEMNKAIATPAEDLKPHAPRMVEVVIDKSFIGAVIGPGGKIIQEIQARTGTIINIEEVGDKGIVTIASTNAEGLQGAKEAIARIAFTPSVGDVYEAEVESLMPYGAFVKFFGQSGLLHVSEVDHKRIEDVSTVLKVGQKIEVKIIGTDPKTGKLRLSRKALLENPNANN
ncbi:MAG: polyribonucleotide nucleotidyltransferase [Saprospiraceae bacterium]|jgi:polyribonucleotide nucleotidyltransferase|nr:polyribonucleotide nucleotidyltransferase [Saprospiraceae bacterium]HMT52392.1 polyribonucleotide nucleotidyltransferase [Saprospiraceae bacterium]HMT69318.1 polyribonucleotide nucleotidyltransferase [Saprospiraceae bacterium]HQV97182.1 polyribonucleotide nucleotidyltransferase [Saprospiraceae bacterium]